MSISISKAKKDKEEKVFSYWSREKRHFPIKYWQDGCNASGDNICDTYWLSFDFSRSYFFQINKFPCYHCICVSVSLTDPLHWSERKKSRWQRKINLMLLLRDREKRKKLTTGNFIEDEKEKNSSSRRSSRISLCKNILHTSEFIFAKVKNWWKREIFFLSFFCKMDKIPFQGRFVRSIATWLIREEERRPWEINNHKIHTLN